jgi:hypothetical protein
MRLPRRCGVFAGWFLSRQCAGSCRVEAVTAAARLVLVLPLWATLACSFKPRSGSSGDVDPDFALKYSRPNPGRVSVTYHALRDHELLQLCVFLLKPKRPAPLSLQSLGWIRATPDACWLQGAASLKGGEDRVFSHDFPRTALVFDGRKDMRLGVRILFQPRGAKPLERFLYP